MLTREQRAELRSATVVPVPLAAAAVGLSVNRAYILGREGRELAEGVRILRIGERKLVVPAAPLRRLLGIEPTEGAPHDD